MIAIKVEPYKEVLRVKGFSKCRKALLILDDEDIAHITEPANPDVLIDIDGDTIYVIKVPYSNVGKAEAMLFANMQEM